MYYLLFYILLLFIEKFINLINFVVQHVIISNTCFIHVNERAIVVCVCVCVSAYVYAGARVCMYLRRCGCVYVCVCKCPPIFLLLLYQKCMPRRGDVRVRLRLSISYHAQSYIREYKQNFLVIIILRVNVRNNVY